MIYMDTREQGVSKQQILDEGAEEVVKATMNCGDYIVGNWLIERKAYGDLVSSMTSTESGLMKQLNAVVSACEKHNEAVNDDDQPSELIEDDSVELGRELTPVLLVEGDLMEGLNYTRITAKQPTYMMTSIFKYTPVEIMHTAGDRASAQFLVKLEEDQTASSPSAIRDSPSVPEEKYPRYLTEGWPGIGPSTAEKLLNHFGSFYDIVNASKEELQEVSGIGSSRAADIYEVTRREYDV